MLGKRDAEEWHLPSSLPMEPLPQLAEVTCSSHTLPDLGSCVASLNRTLSRCSELGGCLPDLPEVTGS